MADERAFIDQLHGDMISRKIAEGKPITLVEFQDFLIGESRRFVVWNLKEMNRGTLARRPESSQNLDKWLKEFGEFIINPPLGS